MQIRESNPSHVVLELSHNELILLNNALNEVCRGLDLPDFSTRLASRTRRTREPSSVKSTRPLRAMAKRKDEG